MLIQGIFYDWIFLSRKDMNLAAVCNPRLKNMLLYDISEAITRGYLQLSTLNVYFGIELILHLLSLLCFSSQSTPQLSTFY